MISSALMIVMCALQSASFRAGFTFEGGWPSMADEKEYSDLLNEGDVDFQLDRMYWSGGLEGLVDASDKVRLRGTFTVSRYRGAFNDELDVFGNLLIGILTGGLVFLFGSDNDVIALEDRATSVEAACYYRISSTPSISIGAGPSYSSVTRSMDTPNTSSSETASGLGFVTGIRIDQETGGFLGLPILFGAEGGYRHRTVELETGYSSGFNVDFSGPYLKVGTYLGF
jgi:hypothetical protein